jgi:hypothetical protein
MVTDDLTDIVAAWMLKGTVSCVSSGIMSIVRLDENHPKSLSLSPTRGVVFSATAQ